MEIANTDSFINAMASAVTGVSIISTDGPAGRFGVTVSAVSSVSAEPPMGLVREVLHTDNVPLAYAHRAYHEPKLININSAEGKTK